MEKHNTRLFTYAIVGILLLVFGVYSNTMRYAYAIDTVTYTLGTNYSVYGGSYLQSEDSWIFASANNNTIIKLADNSSSFTATTYNSGAGTCADAHDIQVIMNGAYLAMICNNGSPSALELQIRKSFAPYELVDYESGFANTEDVFNMAEWVAGKRLYLLNSGAGSPLVYHFNLNNINSTLSPMFAGSVGAFSASTCHDIVVSEQRSQAYVSCIQLTSNDSSFSVIDLTTFTSVQSVQLDSNTSTGGLQIDVWDGNNTVVVTDSLLGDVWVYSLFSGQVNSHNGSVCTEPISPQFNTNTGQIFITCKGNNYIAIYSSVTDTVIGTISVQTFSASAIFGTHSAPKFVWVESQRAGYLAYSFLDPNHGALFNFVTRIQDTTISAGSGTTGATVCIDTTGDTTADLCFTDTNGDGVADSGVAGSLGVYRSGANITNFGFQMNCAFGIGSCTDDNPKTNGVGLIYLLLLVIFSYAFLVAIHIMAVQKISKEHVQVMDAIRINPVLLLAMLVIDVGITFYLGWIPDAIFYTIIVVLAGMAGFGFYRMVKGDNA